MIQKKFLATVLGAVMASAFSLPGSAQQCNDAWGRSIPMHGIAVTATARQMSLKTPATVLRTVPIKAQP